MDQQQSSSTTLQPAADEPPPSYLEVLASDENKDTKLDNTQSLEKTITTPGNLSLPCVIPQTTKSFQGAFHSPFVRAYPHGLAACDIQEADFIAFIDGVNEAFVASPVLQAVGIFGGVMSLVYGVDPVQWAGAGLQLVSGVTSAAVSYVRTRAYFKAMNANMFHPAGLHATVLTTKKMMAKVGMTDEKLHLPPLDYTEQLDEDTLAQTKGKDGEQQQAEISPNDPRMRRIKALEGYVLPLDFNVPPIVRADSFLKRMGDAQARRLARKQERKLMKKRKSDRKKQSKEGRGAGKEQRKGDKHVAKVERKMEKTQAEFQRDMSKEKALNDPKERRKLEREYEKECKKLQKKMDKEIKDRDKKVIERTEDDKKKGSKADRSEERIAQKIRWIVISEWKDEAQEEDGSQGGDDDDVHGENGFHDDDFDSDNELHVDDDLRSEEVDHNNNLSPNGDEKVG